MNDYYQVSFRMTPASEDACDLLADALGEAGFESFVGDDAAPGASMTAFVPAAAFSEDAVREALASLPPGFGATFGY